MEDIELDFGAITIDNSILKSEGYKFYVGLLNQMVQFSDSPVRVIQSDIVHNEAKKHIANEIKNSRVAVEQALRSASKQLKIPQKDIMAATELLSIPGEELEIADKRLKKYYKRIGAEILESKNHIDFEQLMNLYFETKAPFEGAKDKKSEFPDAIALISLENWAEVNGLNIIAVSGDKGWKKFSETSNRITVIDKLSTALAIFQPHNQVRGIIAHIREDALFEEENHILEQITETIIDSLEAENINVNAKSELNFKVRNIDIEYIEHELKVDENGLVDINIVRIEKDIIVLQVKADVSYEVKVAFDFEAKTWSEDYHKNGGSLVSSTEDTYSTNILISLTGNLSEGFENLNVAQIEVIDTVENVYFGEVWPDYRSDYEE